MEISKENKKKGEKKVLKGNNPNWVDFGFNLRSVWGFNKKTWRTTNNRLKTVTMSIEHNQVVDNRLISFLQFILEDE